MNKLIQWAACAAMVTAFALPMTACGPQHVHTWSDWQRSETEHWRVCTICKEEERSEHSTTEGACTSCGYGFRAIGFGFTSGGDAAHADFAREANTWFAEQGAKLGFTYTFGGADFSAMTDENLANYELIILLNNKPGSAAQQNAFRRYMDNGGSCLIFIRRRSPCGITALRPRSGKIGIRTICSAAANTENPPIRTIPIPFPIGIPGTPPPSR